MARTTAENVATIIRVRAEDDLTPFIDVANGLVTQCCTNYPATSSAVVYTDNWLEQIERWLAAHFYAIMRPRNFLEQVDVVRQQIESKIDLGFNVTRYGQQAMRLDFNGGLAALNNAATKVMKTLPGAGRRVGVKWLGSDPPCPEGDSL